VANRLTKLAYREGYKELREGMIKGELAGAFRAAIRNLE